MSPHSVSTMDQPELESPILIMAYIHSGTTLLSKMIGKSSDVFSVGGETRHFRNLVNTKAKYPDLDDDKVLREYLLYLASVICFGYASVNFRGVSDEPLLFGTGYEFDSSELDTLFANAKESRDYNDLYAITFDYLALKTGKKRWLDKLPGYFAQFDQIVDALPGARVIELVRDPRDILASKTKRLKKGGHYDPVWDTLGWKSDVNSGRLASAKHSGMVLRIRYEDLVSEPRETMGHICEFLDLVFDEEMLDVGWINSTSVEIQTKGIGVGAVGKWRGHLSLRDVAICQRIAAQEMIENRYEFARVPSSVYVSFPLVFANSGLEFARRLRQKWNVGGTSYLVGVLSNYRTRLVKLMGVNGDS